MLEEEGAARGNSHRHVETMPVPDKSRAEILTQGLLLPTKPQADKLEQFVLVSLDSNAKQMTRIMQGDFNIIIRL